MRVFILATWNRLFSPSLSRWLLNCFRDNRKSQLEEGVSLCEGGSVIEFRWRWGCMFVGYYSPLAVGCFVTPGVGSFHPARSFLLLLLLLFLWKALFLPVWHCFCEWFEVSLSMFCELELSHKP